MVADPRSARVARSTRRVSRGHAPPRSPAPSRRPRSRPSQDGSTSRARRSSRRASTARRPSSTDSGSASCARSGASSTAGGRRSRSHRRYFDVVLETGENTVVFHDDDDRSLVHAAGRVGRWRGGRLRRAARHSAYSFLDGASQPEELAARAAELGYDGARADRPRRRLRLARVRPRGEGARRAPDHRRRGDARRGGAARDAARRDAAAATRTSAACSPTRTPARAARAGSASCCRRRSTLETLLEHAEGLVCLSGCARTGSAVRDAERRRAARAAPSAASASTSSCSAPTSAATRAETRALRELAATLGVADRRDRRRPRAPRRAHAAPGRARRDPQPHLARRLRARSGAATTRASCSRPDEMPSALPGRPRRRRAHASSSPSGSSST